MTARSIQVSLYVILFANSTGVPVKIPSALPFSDPIHRINFIWVNSLRRGLTWSVLDSCVATVVNYISETDEWVVGWKSYEMKSSEPVSDLCSLLRFRPGGSSWNSTSTLYTEGLIELALKSCCLSLKRNYSWNAVHLWRGGVNRSLSIRYCLFWSAIWLCPNVNISFTAFVHAHHCSYLTSDRHSTPPCLRFSRRSPTFVFWNPYRRGRFRVNYPHSRKRWCYD